MEQNTSTIAKKIWHIMRGAYFMIKKGICKRKILMDLNMMMKRGKIGGKALQNLMFHHHGSALNVGRDGTAYLQYMATHAPKEYEFSCNDTPLYRQYFNKLKTHKNYMPSPVDDINNIEDVNNIFDMMMYSCNASPATPALPSPAVRPLRITDSPFSVQSVEDNKHVDEAAEDFINKFYSQLKQQKYN